MAKYTSIKANGEIRQIGTCPESMLHLQARPGDQIVEGHFDKLTEKFDLRGERPVLTKKTPQEIEEDKPDPIDPQDRGANMTKREQAQLLKRITDLEAR